MELCDTLLKGTPWVGSEADQGFQAENRAARCSVELGGMLKIQAENAGGVLA